MSGPRRCSLRCKLFLGTGGFFFLLFAFEFWSNGVAAKQWRPMRARLAEMREADPPPAPLEDAHTLAGMREAILSRKLPRPQLEFVVLSLEAFERGRAGYGRVFRDEALQISLGLAGGHDILGSGPGDYMALWPFGFSKRAAALDAADHLLRWAPRAAACEAAPWSEVRRISAELHAEARRSFNILVREMTPDVESIVRTERALLAEARLLRIAARYLADGTAIELEDPFGGTLGRELSGRRLKAWSAEAKLSIEVPR